MFKNRAFQVKLVRTDEDGSIVPPPVETQADIVAFAADAAKDVMEHATKLAAIWFAMDTGRKVMLKLIDKL